MKDKNFHEEIILSAVFNIETDCIIINRLVKK